MCKLQKCDGERPNCGQCLRSRAFRDCEYVEDGITRTQKLEEQIAAVGARIEQLEKPKELRTCVGLHNPYSGKRRSTYLPSLSLSGSSAEPPPSHKDSEVTAGPSSPLSLPTSCSERIAPANLDSLIHKFLPHSSQFGFFLNVHNFRESVLGRRGERPIPVLLDVVHLWAIHISGSDEFTAHESIYLSRALRAAVDALSGTHLRNTILHTIQAEVLLPHYFLQNTRFLEGKYHLSAAGLHHIRLADADVPGGPPRPALLRLPPVRDAIEESERINAFWTVLTMNNCWTTADGSPSNISYTAPGARIDTPWPVDINATKLQNQVLPHSSTGTANTFLANLRDNGTSESAFHAKAAILFEQASRISSLFSPNMTGDQRARCCASFTAMDTLIESLKPTLPVIHAQSSRQMLVAHSLTNAATIQMHNTFVGCADISRVRVSDAARAVVSDFAQVTTVLMAACQVFIAELARARSRLPSNVQEEHALLNAIDTVSEMAFFSGNDMVISDVRTEYIPRCGDDNPATSYTISFPNANDPPQKESSGKKNSRKNNIHIINSAGDGYGPHATTMGDIAAKIPSKPSLKRSCEKCGKRPDQKGPGYSSHWKEHKKLCQVYRKADDRERDVATRGLVTKELFVSQATLRKWYYDNVDIVDYTIMQTMELYKGRAHELWRTHAVSISLNGGEKGKIITASDMCFDDAEAVSFATLAQTGRPTLSDAFLNLVGKGKRIIVIFILERDMRLMFIKGHDLPLDEEWAKMEEDPMWRMHIRLRDMAQGSDEEDED
ncbi:hypothetical protein DFH06DRAFT_1121169 [Mycena polygramma]|nr:hypothetical protein DFH06DRAFT_1121169 [Mycena polygramma]